MEGFQAGLYFLCLSWGVGGIIAIIGWINSYASCFDGDKEEQRVREIWLRWVVSFFVLFLITGFVANSWPDLVPLVSRRLH